MRRLAQALLALSATSGTNAASAQDGDVARLVAALAAPSRAERLQAQEALLALSAEAQGSLENALAPPGFEANAALAYVRAHRPRHPRSILVPAGAYRLGSDVPADQNPSREVELAAFRIDETEVTSFEWWRFVRSAQAAPPVDWIGGRYRYGGESLPVGNVAAEEATKFAKWAGGRLPTSDEWEAAAHGGSPRSYPWGEDFEGHLSRIPLTNVIFASEPPDVGSEPEDRSPFGRDFCSSLLEWVTLPDGRFATRGGSYSSGKKEMLRLTRGPDPNARRRRVNGVRIVDRRP